MSEKNKKFKELRRYFKNHEDQEFYFDDSELEDIMNYAVREHKFRANIGLNPERVKYNEREKAFQEQWLKENEPISWINNGGGILQDLCTNYNNEIESWKRRSIIVNNQERMIVATVIQWLGSNIGFSFLEESLKKCGYKITKI